MQDEISQAAQPSQEPAQAFANTAAAPEQFSKAELEEAVRIRLRKERQRAEESAKAAEESAKTAQELRKRLDELENKFKSGKATTAETEQYVKAQNTMQEADAASIPVSAIPKIIQTHEELMKFENNLVEAAQKDKELKALLEDPASLEKISVEELKQLKHLPNAGAVFKHLLTDDRDRDILKAAERAWIGPNGDGIGGDGGVSFKTFVNNLSKQLEGTAKYPKPPSYKPAPNLDDAGQTDTFTVSGYISRKYG